MIRSLLLALAALLLVGCVETRFESPPGERIQRCDETWKGVWLDRSDDSQVAGLHVDEQCRSFALTQLEAGGPLRQAPVPLNFVEHRGQRYVVVADAALQDLVTLPPVHGVDPVPTRNFFIARYRLRGGTLEIHKVDDRAAARMVIDGVLQGTVSSTLNELHVYVRGTREDTLRIVETPGLFERRPSIVLERSRRSLAEIEAELMRAHALHPRGRN
ncbi:MAG: hypothetical protein MEQ07_00150 [Aquimonas sp.]|nr:hypothetical protein [Aquimonas sp.]